MTALNLIFAGTPTFAARHLQALLCSQHRVIAAYTQPDRPAGRGKKLSPSAVKTLALEHEIPVYQPASFKSEAVQNELAALKPDLMVVVAYGLILPRAVLSLPTHGCINVHGSILPQWRGAAPIQRAIEAGDSRSGVTIMQMDAGLDTGDMLLTAECPILTHDTSNDLHNRLCEIGPPALLQTLDQLANGALEGRQQNDADSSYATKIEKSEAHVDWSQTAAVIDRKIRAFNPFPICYGTLGEKRLKIHRAQVIEQESQGQAGAISLTHNGLSVQCGSGSLALEEVQLPGKKVMPAQAFINGFSSLIDDTSILA